LPGGGGRDERGGHGERAAARRGVVGGTVGECRTMVVEKVGRRSGVFVVDLGEWGEEEGPSFLLS